MSAMSEQREPAEGSQEVVPAPAPAPVEPAAAKPKSCFGSFMALAGVLFGGLYVINPGAGVIELIPDIVPLFGNLDEAAATTLLVLGLQYLFGRRR